MALHKLIVDDFQDPYFSLIAVHCRLDDYRLAYLLNEHLDLNLKRKPYDLDYNYHKNSFAIYEWNDEKQYITWNLVSNISKKEEDDVTNTNSLFNEQSKILKKNYLISELKNVDYLIKITYQNQYFNEKASINTLQSIPQIMTAYNIDVSQVKSKENLIFN